MAGLTGLFKRGGSFYLRIVLPANHPLRGRYANGRFVQTLGPCSHRDAVIKGTKLRAEVLCALVLVDQHASALPIAVRATAAADQSQETHRPAQPLRLGDVYNRWKASKARTSDSMAACARAVALYEQCLGNQDLHTLSRGQGDQFRAWLLAQGGTTKTARDRFTWVKSLLKYATRDLELLTKSPWEGLDIAAKTTSKRRPWRPDELTTLFSQPLFQQYALPSTTKAGEDAAYWVPLLGLFTGARISELAQLRPQDVIDHHHPAMLSISDEGTDQALKTEASVRSVPIHPELVRLGFLDYVEKVRETKASTLWPSMKLRKGKAGGYISQWFGLFRRSIGMMETNPDFHSFRHLVRTQMARAGVDSKAQDHITGHKTSGSVGTRVYQEVDENDLLAAITTVQYPFLELPRVYGVTPNQAHRRGWSTVEDPATEDRQRCL